LTGVEKRIVERLDSLEQQVTKLVQPRKERLQKLEELNKESRNRCIDRFNLVIQNLDGAISLADNSSIGLLPSELDLSVGYVIALTGGFGIGKTLIAERIFQKAIEQAKQEANSNLKCNT
jgi:predicted ATPase